MPRDDDSTLRLHVDDVDELFVAPTPRPFDEHPGYWAGLEQIYRVIRPSRLLRPSRLVVVLPEPSADRELTTKTKEAITRWSELRIAAARSEIAFHRREGLVKLLLGVVFLSITLALTQALEEATSLPTFFQTFLIEGLTIIGWVVLWTPIGIFLYDWWPHRQDIRVYRHIANMRVELAGATPNRGGEGLAPR